jgi:hypothetical protein
MLTFQFFGRVSNENDGTVNIFLDKGNEIDATVSSKGNEGTVSIFGGGR